MYEEKRELAEWFNDFKQDELRKIEGLETVVQYGKGVSSLLGEIPNFEGTSPLYNVVQIDKVLELYTLMEATNTDGVGDILKGIISSHLIPATSNIIEAMQRANMKSGLVCYAQPKIAENGDLLEHNISLETTMPISGASDLIVIIAKTGARLNIKHEYKGGNDNSFLGRMIIVICEDGAMVRFKDVAMSGKGSIYNQYINIVGPASNVTSTLMLKNFKYARLNAEYYLLGEGSNCSSDVISIAKENEKYDISCVAHLKSESSHASIHTACAAFDESHIVYRDGIVSNSETEGSVDEGKLLIVGSDSRIDILPIKESHTVRHVTQSHLDKADDITLEQFFGRIVDAGLFKEILDK